ncbi:MAG: PspC domain-containing protein [Pseudonocardiales bacterium]
MTQDDRDTEGTATAQETFAPPPADPPTSRPALRRSSVDRKIAGVCGGLGRYTGIDPIVFRVVLAVTSIFGGLGLLIYLGAWLFLSADGDTASPVEALLGRGLSRTSATNTLLLAVAACLALAFVVGRPSFPLVALAVVGVVLFVRHRQPAGLTTISDAPGATFSPPVAESHPPDPPPFAPHGPYGPPYAGAPVVPPLPTPRRVPSPLGRIVLSATLLLVGAMAAIDQVHGVHIPAPAYVAAALALVGCGLVVGAWFGHARWLIAVGLVLCVALAVASAVPHARHIGTATGNRTWVPMHASDIHAVYQLGAGNATLDLTRVDFTDATAATTVHLGVGEVRVLLPAHVDAIVHGSTGAGALEILGKRANGTGLRETVTDPGADGTGGGTLHLFLDNGIGNVEVTREQA